MERKFMQPPEKPLEPRIGPQFQAQIPEIKPKPFKGQKRPGAELDVPVKRQNLN